MSEDCGEYIVVVIDDDDAAATAEAEAVAPPGLFDAAATAADAVVDGIIAVDS